MRRRRQKNTLLPKMLGLAVLINAILLPILAQFGVFKSIGGSQQLTPVELVKLPPPEKKPATPKQKPKKVAAKPHPAGHKAEPRTAAAHHAPPGPPPVKVVATAPSSGAGPGGGGDAGITGSDSGPTLPVGLPSTKGDTVPTPTPAPAIPPAPVPSSAPTSPVAPPVAHVPVIVPAIPISQPGPEIPDDLRDTELHASFEGLFTVHVDGTATVQMVSGTGNSTLDALAKEAARRWTFHPATRDGQPVESYLRLKIEFEVGT